MRRLIRFLLASAVMGASAIVAPALAEASNVPPVLTWSPSVHGVYNFGTLAIGAKTSTTFTLTNIGGEVSSDVNIRSSDQPRLRFCLTGALNAA